MIDSRPLVRVATAGSVDDGKSTFIGRLLFDCQAILDDQLATIERASRQSGEAEVNLALLTDGLRAEREQKITIDVSYRPFATAKRRFLLADSPGHEQYTRNMFTGASTADIAILLVDAVRGPTSQTKRHAFIASLLRVPHVIVAVNKMDLVGFQEEAFERHVNSLRAYISNLEFADIRFVPVSALRGDGVAQNGSNMPWYQGPSVLDTIQDVELSSRQTPVDFRFPVQCVIRPNHEIRALAGQPVSGSIRVGEEVLVMPSGRTTSVKSIASPEGPMDKCDTGQPVVIELEEDLDVGRGDLLVRPKNPATQGQVCEATVCWMGDAPARVGAPYRLLRASRDTLCHLEEIIYRIDIQTLHRELNAPLAMNDIGRIRLRSVRPESLDLYERNRATGSFVIADPTTNEVAAAGVITRILADSTELLPNRSGLVFWLTGLSGSGKSTIAEHVASELRRVGTQVVHLDGDSLRSGLNGDLGFSEQDRDENIRRTAELAKLLSAQGFVVLCSLISPLRKQRQRARDIIGSSFQEIYVSCPIEVAESRDPKGLYARARRGEILDFTGVSAPYEEPLSPDLSIQTATLAPEESFSVVLDFLKRTIEGP